MRVRCRRCSFNHHIERKIGKKGDYIKRGEGNLNFLSVVIMIVYLRVTQEKKKKKKKKGNCPLENLIAEGKKLKNS